MRAILALTALVALAGCGADGEPVRPTAAATIGVGSGGVHGGARVGVIKGPVSISYGIF